MNDKVNIITVNYNQNDHTIKCVESLLQTEYKNYHIHVIDNGPTEEKHRELQNRLPKDERVILHRIEENRGYVGGVNFGLEKAAKLNTDYFFILNNDTLIDKKALSELMNTCKNYNNKAIVTGKVYYYDEPQKLQDIGYTLKNKKKLIYNKIGLNEIDTGQYDEIKERDLLDDVFWLLPQKLYDEIGGYSPYFWFNSEQADFALRAKKAGYKLIFTPNAKLWHKGSASIGGRDRNPKLVYWHIQSTLIFRFLHLTRPQFFIQYIKIIYGIIGTFFKAIFIKSESKENSIEYAKAKLYGLRYFNKWVIKRNKNNGFNPFA